MRTLLAAALAVLPLTASADPVVDRVIDQIALPNLATLAEATTTLATAAQSDCTATSEPLRTAWNAAMDAWLGVQDLRFGPLEDGARRQAIEYWPDTAGYRERALTRILSGQDPILQTPQNYGDEPVSARGLMALETMLYDPAFNGYGPADPGCALVQAASADLARTAATLRADWTGGFADTLRTAGDPGNTRFLDPQEARQAIFTALLTSLQFDATERLGLPLGSFDKPRPQRAEARLSERSQRNLDLSLAAHEALALALVSDPEQTQATRDDFERVRWMVAQLDDPAFAGVADPEKRFKIEALQGAVSMLRDTVNTELSAPLGVSMGLNALDGD